MKEINGNCPRCNQYRLLRSINYIDDRRHGMVISKDPKFINYLCYNCLSEIEKGIKQGKGIVELVGPDFIIYGSGLLKYLDKISNDVGIEYSIISSSCDFINFIYSRWIPIPSDQKHKYYLASLLMLLGHKNLEEKKRQLENYIEEYFKDTSMNEIREKINEIEEWRNSRNYTIFNS